ncbi:MAG: hypothetical protein AB7Q17_14945 [Phycisphaerae bacterium]
MRIPKAASRPTRGRARVSPGAVLLAFALLGAAGGAWWLTRTRGLDWSVSRGLQLLAQAGSSDAADHAVRQWERETGAAWTNRHEELAARILNRYEVDDPRVQRMLARVTGTDYGDRTADWQRFRDDWKRRRAGEPPKLASVDRVRLERLWRAPVGLTAWFSAVLPIDDAVYVASLGAAFDDAGDEADGVVRVRADGAVEYLFRSTERGPRDVMGLAAGDDGLFVACRNGFVHFVNRNGVERWKQNIGAAIIAPPLSLDVNRDGVSDGVIAARGGKLAAISGVSGKIIWSTAGARRHGAPGDESVGVRLAAGRVLGGSAPDILVTAADGSVRVLTASTGATRGETSAAAGILAGPVANSAVDGVGGYIADQRATIYRVERARGGLRVAPTWSAALDFSASVVAAPRTVGAPDGPPQVLVCTAGPFEGPGSSVGLYGVEGARWRVGTRGVVWGAPVVANLNEDRALEIAVTTIERDAAGAERGVLVILSSAGHVLREIALEAPAECSPAVADLDGDGKLELLIADRAGWLHCFATHGRGPVEWGCLAGDSHNSGESENAYSYGQSPPGYQWGWKPIH